MPLPYGSPSAPACEISDRIFAASTGIGNAGTVTLSVPRYVDELVTSLLAPPVAVHAVPRRSGSVRSGVREPQARLYSELARLLPHGLCLAHRIGKEAGGSVLDQSATSSPEDVSWNTIWPAVSTASSPLPCSSVVHASVNDAPFCSFTVTFSAVGVPL